MDKLDLQTPDFTSANIARMLELFPNCRTERKAPDGAMRSTIDFDLLRQELSYDLVEGPQERYRLDWPGKREALATANAPIRKTLRPCKEESVNFETTKNLYIEGDNLDALKLLQETYLGKIKMIYIDPPYNTGNDFIYDDNFSISREEYEALAGGRDQEGNAMFDEEKWKQNSSSSGRFHSEWLSMIYPRLKLARNLLKEDGVIFISIDDNEAHNIKRLCDEVFGSSCFMGNLVWKRRVSSSLAHNYLSTDHEYVFVYSKTDSVRLNGTKKTGERYSNPDKDPRGPWIADNLTVGMNASMRPNQAYDLIDPITGNIYPFNPNRVWAFIPSSMAKMIQEGRILFPKDSTKRPMQKRFFNELKNECDPLSSLIIDKVGLNSEATRMVQDLFDANLFDYSKPLSLIYTLLPQATDRDDIILDFFSGSATTAHAVMQLNAEDGGTRRHIMVQLPEPCDEKSEAFKAGYKTITEIGKERIRRAGKKIRTELEEKLTKELKGSEENSSIKSRLDSLDTGFRVIKIDSSNMADVYYQPDEVTQDGLALQVDNLKQDRNPEDLLFQVLLDWGVDLALPITEETILKHRVFFVADNALAACFDTGLDEAFVKELAKRQPLRAVFRDSGYASDAVKINFEQIFKALSPHTEIKTL